MSPSPCSEIVDFAFTWKIENFTDKLSNDPILSPIFDVTDFLQNTQWKLLLDPSDDFIGFYLSLENGASVSNSTQIEFTLTIVAADISSHISKNVNKKTFSASESAFGFAKVVSVKKILKERHLYLPQGILTIQCYMIQKEDIDEIPEDDSTPLQNFNHTQTLYKDLYDLYLNNKLCDIEMKTSDRVFNVHKTVICARSPVFCAMFEGDTKEKNSGVVNIMDIDSCTVSSMLTFMYSDSIEDLTLDQASKLYTAADKYCILPLKQKCSTLLKSLLSYANVGDVYVLADMHEDVNLKSAVQNYIFIYAKRVFKSSEWEHFMKFHPELSAEIMHFLWIKQLDD